MDDQKPPGVGGAARCLERNDRTVQAHKDRLARAYAERNALAVAFVKMAVAIGWPAGHAIDPRPRKGWDPNWNHLVCVLLPEGHLLRWHLSPDDLPLLEGIPRYAGLTSGATAARHGDWPLLLQAALKCSAGRWARPGGGPERIVDEQHASPKTSSLNTEDARQRVRASYWGPRTFRVEEFATFNAALAWLIRNRHTVVKEATIEEPNAADRMYTQVRLNELAVAMEGQRRPARP